MLAIMSQYIKNIALLTVFIAFTGIIIPDGKYKRYIDVVMGLILVFVMITPLAGWFSGGSGDGAALVQSLTGGQPQEGVFPEGYDIDLQSEMVDKNFKAMMKKQVGELVAAEGFGLEAFDLKYKRDSGEVEVMTLVVSPTEEEEGRVKLIRIEPVNIRSGSAPQTADEETEDVKKLKKVISDFYNAGQDNIYITVRKKNRGR